MAGRNTYDIDPVQREILEHRAARRQMLREEYLKQHLNPYRAMANQGGALDDIAINRYTAMRATFKEFARPTVKNSLWTLCFFVTPFVIAVVSAKYIRDKQENKIRTGQVSYRDRDYKFK
ncbi:hypothetical protein PV325_007600 [Microctonus aethiopoides]|uniref:NADH dehydrogenase [ubiquinone] 1 beta subcomplex subunit 4 n=1 Tax=Microctonus aethiopoides TaxID=144406 RepID=A0AA39FVN4_9HYME|nr:hypothetical protein PV325_007600 [Microctonus aethiopoides]KAK0176356.1 hypothetical protein PV328_000501 [Microctonus aethiopoides]